MSSLKWNEIARMDRDQLFDLIENLDAVIGVLEGRLAAVEQRLQDLHQESEARAEKSEQSAPQGDDSFKFIALQEVAESGCNCDGCLCK